MVGSSGRLSPQKDGNHSRLSIDSTNSSDAVVDSAANLVVTVHPLTTDNDNGGRILGNLDIILADYQKQKEINEKVIRDIAARGSGRTSADQSIESLISEMDELTERDNEILKILKCDIHRANKRSAEIIRHQEQAAEAERKAKRRPLKFMVDGTKSTIYGLPESFGKYVMEVGRLKVIKQERDNTLCASQAYEKFGHLIWNDPRPLWLRPLLLPNVKEVIPTGWVKDVATGLVRPCEKLDPRIPESYDADGNRVPVDSNEQIGLVLSRIGDLGDTDRRAILGTCYGLKDAEVEKVLDENEHCLIRIYLGRSSDDDELDDCRDSVSDVIMEDPLEEDEFTLFDKPVLSGFLDRIINACGRTIARYAVNELAREIAFGHAILHWGARLDGRGIEFLLGSSPTGVGKRLYMLNFKDCRPIGDLTARCVLDQLVPAALDNDPFIPRATTWEDSDEKEWCPRSRKLVHTYRSYQALAWQAFTGHYLEASAKIWEGSGRAFDPCLPGNFIKELKNRFFEQDAERYADGVSTECHYAESDAMDIDDSSEGEEDGDEDDDDYDDED
ncbi:hypothetical protein SLS64_007795 [Diaporthe eres]